MDTENKKTTEETKETKEQQGTQENQDNNTTTTITMESKPKISLMTVGKTLVKVAGYGLAGLAGFLIRGWIDSRNDTDEEEKTEETSTSEDDTTEF